MSRVAMLSLHTSPLVQPGGGDAGVFAGVDAEDIAGTQLVVPAGVLEVHFYRGPTAEAPLRVPCPRPNLIRFDSAVVRHKP